MTDNSIKNSSGKPQIREAPNWKKALLTPEFKLAIIRKKVCLFNRGIPKASSRGAWGKNMPARTRVQLESRANPPIKTDYVAIAQPPPRKI